MRGFESRQPKLSSAAVSLVKSIVLAMMLASGKDFLINQVGGGASVKVLGQI